MEIFVHGYFINFVTHYHSICFKRNELVKEHPSLVSEGAYQLPSWLRTDLLLPVLCRCSSYSVSSCFQTN